MNIDAIVVNSERNLAAYAATEAFSGAREHREPPPAFRSQFQRDRDRIVHCSAFRRLEYKTQVFVNHEGDMFRTRLTHSLEVAQIARTVARALALNEDLTETIALAHDLGHTPFGHAGQDALNHCMGDFGGFEHNQQSLRIVEHLEQRYPEFDGLNLLFESREGILKHCSARDARKLGQLGLRFLNKTQPSLEAQLANAADEIAYNHHDIDDGLRAHLLRIEQLQEIPLFDDLLGTAQRRWKKSGSKQILHSVIREMLNYFIVDLIHSSQARLSEIAPGSLNEVRAQKQPIIAFSDGAQAQHFSLKRLLRNNLYHHERVIENASRAGLMVNELFGTFLADPQLLPPDRQVEKSDPSQCARCIADYVAGMTDRFAIAEHRRIFGYDLFTSA